MKYLNIFYYNCDLSYTNTDLLKHANVISSDFIYPSARHNIFIYPSARHNIFIYPSARYNIFIYPPARHNIFIPTVNIVGIPTCVQQLST
jgi:hypothetical protein